MDSVVNEIINSCSRNSLLATFWTTEGMSGAEVAERLKISPNAVRLRKLRTIGRIEEILIDHCDLLDDMSKILGRLRRKL